MPRSRADTVPHQQPRALSVAGGGCRPLLYRHAGIATPLPLVPDGLNFTEAYQLIFIIESIYYYNKKIIGQGFYGQRSRAGRRRLRVGRFGYRAAARYPHRWQGAQNEKLKLPII